MAYQWEERDRSYDRDDRGYQGRERDRGMVRRAGDEVRSWFGDDEAAARRRMDEVRNDAEERYWRDRRPRSAERGWDRVRETVRDVTDRDRDGRRGLDEWNDDDRRWRSVPSYYSGSGRWQEDAGSLDRDRDRWTREGSFGDPGRYGTADPHTNSRWTRPFDDSRGDWRGTNYIGRGPRGYKRGDERIREDVCDRLTDDPRIDASDIEVQVVDSEVTINGSVRSREEKRFAEDLIERVTGVREVNNNLKVRRSDEVLGTARSGASTLGLTETPPPTQSKTK